MPASLRRGQRSGNNHAAGGSATRVLRAICLAVLLALTPALAGPGMAQEDPLVQRGIPAEATAETAVLAREQALNNGQRLAYERMAASLGMNPRASDAQIEGMVRSLIIESERISARTYTARITVNFNPQRVAAAGGRAPAPAFDGSAPAAPPGAPAAAPNPGSGPAVTTVEALASYRSFAEWVEITRRLSTAAPVARMQVVAVAADGARLRLSLRAQPAEAAAGMADSGLFLSPTMADPRLPPNPVPGREGWRLSLAGAR
ncbi:hypothetical protein [Falsiroseomonas sp. E2-1-a20]|uniref:hypothetical protein n=1 Tax=Falsiroseomonas sp. E2-1-a20 TaxID=3239300 RepID=UPI003F314C49